MKMTVKFIWLFVLIFCIANSANAFENTLTESGLEKCYIQSTDVHVANNGIFVNLEGVMLRVSAVFVDDAGVYIAGHGRCSRCGWPCDDLGRCQNVKCPNYRK